MKSYVILGNRPFLTLNKGAVINEYERYCVLSRFCDVYYNDIKFFPDKPFSRETSVNLPSRDYDFTFVRSGLNTPDKKKFFLNLPGIKFWHGPYDPDIYRCADAVVAMTEQHRARLYKKPERVSPQNWFPPKKVILFGQALTDNFFTKINSNLNETKFVVGFSGYVGPKRRPTEALESFASFSKTLCRKDACSLKYFGAKLQIRRKTMSREEKKIWERHVEHISLPHKKMPSALATLDAYIDTVSFQKAHFSGSRSVLEAAASGVPVICGDFETRKTLFGEDYPLMWDNKLAFGGDAKRKRIVSLLKKLKEDLAFRRDMQRHVQMCARKHHIDHMAKQYKEEVKSVIG